MIIGIASGDYLPAEKSPDGIEKWGGAGWARIGQYVEGWRAAGHDVAVGVLWREGDMLAINTAEGKAFPDLIILQRIMHGGVDDAIRAGRSLGQIVINDVDDWYWGLDTRNEAFLASHPKRSADENTANYWKTVHASSMVTVSTPYLQDRIHDRTRPIPIEVVPNFVDISRFSKVEQQPVPTFGWAGSTSHRSGDVETLRGIFNRFVVADQLHMHHSGDLLGSPSFASQINMDPVLITTSPRVQSSEYPSLLSFDVGLVPLRDTPFNRAKSEIKGMEYAASGIPFIAQGLPSYKQLHKDWEGAFCIADRPRDWIKHTKRLLDIDTRLEYQERLLDCVKSRDIHYGTTSWIKLLEEIV